MAGTGRARTEPKGAHADRSMHTCGVILRLAIVVVLHVVWCPSRFPECVPNL